jgi:ubiquinone/menaquinone biosynthesis C-methylase UbiE
MLLSSDVPSPVNFHNAAEAHKWANEALAKCPGRLHMFQRFVSELNELPSPPRTVLELGAGPGFLAEQILLQCSAVENYYLLDFSDAMLSMSRSRLRQFGDRAQFIHADFKNSAWTGFVPSQPDVVVSMQAVHEVRNKRYVPKLYNEVASLLPHAGALLVCDHLPKDKTDPQNSLYMEQHEQMTALAMAGFHERGMRALLGGLALYRAQFGGAAQDVAE